MQPGWQERAGPLSETHRGVWNLFQQSYVDGGRFDQKLLREARASQRAREATDYDAGHFSTEEATKLMELGDRFVRAVEEMLTEDPPTT